MFSDTPVAFAPAPVTEERRREPVLSPYQRRKTISGSEFDLLGQPTARRSARDADSGPYNNGLASPAALPAPGDARGGNTPRNTYENVRAILRQGRERRQSSVVERYYSQQRDQYQPYHSSAGGAEPRRLSGPGVNGAQATQVTPAPSSRGYPLLAATPAGSSAMKVFMGPGLEGQMQDPADAEGRASGSPVHAFQRRRTSWTPMRPSSTASRMKTLKRSFVATQGQGSHNKHQQQQEGDFRSPTKRARPSPGPVYSRGNLLTPADRLKRESGGGEAQARTPKAAQLTTETAKRILSTLDSLTSPGSAEKMDQDAAVGDALRVPQKLKFNLPEADLKAPSPPSGSLRHFKQAKASPSSTADGQIAKPSVAAAGGQDEKPAPPKKWPAAFLAKNKAMVDKAVEDVEKEIEQAKSGGLPAPKPAEEAEDSAKAPTFTFGAPQSPTVGKVVFGSSAPTGFTFGAPASDAKKPAFSFGSSGFPFGAPPSEPQVGSDASRSYSFGESELTESEKRLAKAVESAPGDVSPSGRTFAFGGAEAGSGELREANTTAVKAAALPLPAEEEEEQEEQEAPPAMKKWPSSFLASNKKQNDSAVAAVAEEIEKAKNPAPALEAAKPGVPTFNFGTPAAKGAAEDAAAKPFTFGAAGGSIAGSSTPSFSFGSKPAEPPLAKKATDIFSFGSAPKPAPQKDEVKPAASPFTFGSAKPAGVSEEPEKEKESTPFKPQPFTFGAAGGSIAGSSTPSFSFGSKPAEPSAAKNKRKSEEEAPAAKKAVFTFGATPAPAATEEPKEAATKASEASPFAFGAAAAAPKQPTAFGFGSAGDKVASKPAEPAEPAAKSSAPVFAFGSSAPSTGAAAVTPSPFSFSATEAGGTGAAKEKETLGGFSSASAGGAFQFGASAPTFSAGPSASSSSQPSPFTFGAGTGASKPQSQPSSFGASPFGGSQSQAAPATPGAFGQQSAPAFAFGSSTPSLDAKPATPSPFGGGGSSGPSFGASAPAFGGFGGANAAPSASSTPAPFAFGAQAPPSQPATPSFGAPPAPSSAPAFGAAPVGGMPGAFGSAAPAAPASTGGFGFGAASQAQPSFGASPAAPAFGAQTAPSQQSTPAFGGFGSPMPPAGGPGPAGGGFSMGVGPTSTPQSGRRKVKAKPSWRKK